MPPKSGGIVLLHIGFGRQVEMLVAQADNIGALVKVVAADLYRLGYPAFAAVVPNGGGAGRAFAGQRPQFFNAV